MYKQFIFSAALTGCALVIPFQLAWAETSIVRSSQVSEHMQLADLVRLVITEHPRARSIDATQQASSAQFQAADQPLYNPELELDVERTDTNTTSLGISQTIDWSDKRDARVKTASHKRNAATATAELNRQHLAIELLEALQEYHTADTLNKQGNQRLQLMQQFAAVAKERNLAGDLNQIELDLAKLTALTTKLESTELAVRLSDAEQVLQALFGKLPAPTSWPTLPRSLPTIYQSEIDTDELLRGHPTFRTQQAQVMAARTMIELRRRETRPDPTISVRTGRDDNETLTGLTLSVPLFVRNSYSAEVDEASANLIQAERDTQTLWLNLNKQLKTTSQRYALTHETWIEWQQSGETSLSSRIVLLERLWKSGELSTTDYLVQVKQTLDTQSAATKLRGRVWQAWSDWLAASGTVFKWMNIDDIASPLN